MVNGNITLLEKDSHYELHFSCFDGFKLLGKQKLICNNQEFDNESKPQCVQGMQTSHFTFNIEFQIQVDRIVPRIL